MERFLECFAIHGLNLTPGAVRPAARIPAIFSRQACLEVRQLYSGIKVDYHGPHLISDIFSRPKALFPEMSQPPDTESGPFLSRLVKVFIALLTLSGIFFILWLDTWFSNSLDLPRLSRDMGYSLLLLVGFLSSFHCVGMCGPLIFGYATKNAAKGQPLHSAHLLYGIGKTLSYTLIGALFGLFGSIIAFTPTAQGLVGMAAGVFLILFGLHMLEWFPVLNHFQLRVPRFVMRFIGTEYRRHSNPFIIGLLNGLMIICGPLQAMYIMAAGSGSGMEGARILFFFGIGTLPLLLGFGFLTSLFSKTLTPKLLKVSGVIVMALGAVMLNRGLTVTGSGLDFNSAMAAVRYAVQSDNNLPANADNTQTIRMNVLYSGYEPSSFTLQNNQPVKWQIETKELGFCNQTLVVPKLNMKIDLKSGRQTVEFTPTETGVIPFSCSMGMLNGNFIIVDEQKESGAMDKLGDAIQPIWQKMQAALDEMLAGR